MNYLQSELFSLSKSDWAKGLFVAVLGAVLTAIQQALVHGTLSSIDWGSVGNIAIAAGFAYLAKQYLTDTQGNVLGIFGGR